MSMRGMRVCTGTPESAPAPAPAPVPVCRTRTSPVRIARFFGEVQARWILQKDRKLVGRWMKEELTALGPAFIKLGQFFSTRPDIFGAEAALELSRLQDDIKSEAFEDICWVIEDSLQGPINTVFREIDPVSLASASIGQVHKATLLDGTPVVIKVQKPCVSRQIQEDIATLNHLNKIYSFTGSARSLEFQNILNQYDSFLSAELDYTIEAEHMITFRDLLDGLPVRIPRVYSQYSSRNLLVMEYVPSTKITDLDAAQVDTPRIADSLVEVFLYQIIVLGYIHCDPHPGNIGVEEDGETLVLYDFGNVVKLSPEFRKEIHTLIFSIFQKDVDDFVHILEKLKILEIRDDVERLELKEFFRSFFVYLETVDFQTLRSSIVQQGLQGGDNIKIRVDPDFLALFRVFSLLDGTCVRLDPNFNYLEAIQPYAQDLLKDTKFITDRIKKDWDKLRSYPTMMRSTDDNMLRLHKRVASMNLTLQRFQVVSILFLCLPTEDTTALVLTCVGMMTAYKAWDHKQNSEK